MTTSSDRARIDVTLAGRTDTGRTRTENQDTFLALEPSASLSDASGGSKGGVTLRPNSSEGESRGERSFPLAPEGVLLFVADGMGGAAGGATASHLAVTTVAEELQRHLAEADGSFAPDDFARLLDESVQFANEKIQEKARERPELRGMGTTFTGGAVLGGKLVLAQVGDSRGYLLRNGKLIQLTRDQSVVQEMVDAGALTPEEARRSPQRNMILQALGTSPTLEVVSSQKDLRRDDVILLCSDGLCGVVEDHAIAVTLQAASDLDEACDALVAQANEAGGPDNITVLLARVSGDGLNPPDRKSDPDAQTRAQRLPPRP